MRLALPLFLLAVAAFVADANDAERVTVETDSVVLVGLRAPSTPLGGSFLGVAYAEPPVKSLRFAPPKPITNRTMSQAKPVVPANRPAAACLQVGEVTRSTSEDCLYLNLHVASLRNGSDADAEVEADVVEIEETSQADDEGALDVIVWLHGGFFASGDASDASGGLEFASDGGVVLVEVAYRLGVFGFLSSGDATAGGNFGLMDQLEALRWLRHNLRFFNGNAASVTLAGVDAGAASAGLHLLNEESVGLFARVAMFGGSPLAPWSLPSGDSASESRATFGRIAEAVDCVADTASKTLSCLRLANASELMAASQEKLSAPDLATPRFPVVVDGAFLTVDPVEAFASGRFRRRPALLGVVEHEGRQLAKKAMKAANVSSADLLVGDAQSQTLDAAFRHFPRRPQLLTSLGREFLHQQLAAEPGDLEAQRNLQLLQGAAGNWFFVCSTNQFIDLLAEGDNSSSFAYWLEGAEHADDALNFFGRVKDSNRNVSSAMKMALLHFVAGANLQKEFGWMPATRDGGEYFRFGLSQDGVSSVGGFNRQSCRLWRRLLPWVLGLQDGETTRATSTPDTGTEEDDFWPRCSMMFNTMSIIVSAAGGSIILMLLCGIACLTCSRNRRWPSRDTEMRYCTDDYLDDEEVEEEDAEINRKSNGRRPEERRTSRM